MDTQTESALKILQVFAEVGGLSTFIFAATAQAKQLGATGKTLTIIAFVIGIVFGGAYRYFVYNPVTPLDYFWLVSFGLIGGFIATGAYDGAKSAANGSTVNNYTLSTKSEIDAWDVERALAKK